MATKTEAQQLRDKYPNAWIAVEEGDRLEGIVVRVARAWSDARARNSDGFYPLLEVQTADGSVLGFHAFSTVSYNRVIDARPRPGERIVVTYTGLGRKKEGMNAPKLFTLTMPDRDPVQEANAVYDMFGDARSNRPEPQPDQGYDPVRTDSDGNPI